MKNVKKKTLLATLIISGITDANSNTLENNIAQDSHIANNNPKFLYTLNNRDKEYFGMVYQIDPINGKLYFKSQESFNLSTQSLTSLNITPDGRNIFVISPDQIYAYDINPATGELIRNPDLDIFDKSGNIVYFSDIKFHPNGKYIYTFSFFNRLGKIKIAVWELKNGKYVVVNTSGDDLKRKSSKLGVKITDDGNYLYISTRLDSEILAYKIEENGKTIRHISSNKIDKPILWSFTINHQNNHLFTFNSNNEIVNMGEYVQENSTLQNLNNSPITILSYLENPLFSRYNNFIYGLGCNNYNGHGALYSINPKTSAISLLSNEGIFSCLSAKYNIDAQGTHLYLYADKAHQLQTFTINNNYGSISYVDNLSLPKDSKVTSITIQK